MAGACELGGQCPTKICPKNNFHDNSLMSTKRVNLIGNIYRERSRKSNINSFSSFSIICDTKMKFTLSEKMNFTQFQPRFAQVRKINFAFTEERRACMLLYSCDFLRAVSGGFC